MNILLTNDDGYDAPGLRAAYEAISEFGHVFVVAPSYEQSACSHKITVRSPITVRRIHHRPFGDTFMVDGTPADCVRLAVQELLPEPPDLVLSGINAGANTGVASFYSGTVAAAREGAILGLRAIAASLAFRKGVEMEWERAAEVLRFLMPDLLDEKLNGPGLISVNLPAPIPVDYRQKISDAPVSLDPMKFRFRREEVEKDRVIEFSYPNVFWGYEPPGTSDYTIVRDGGIAISRIPLVGRF